MSVVILVERICLYKYISSQIILMCLQLITSYSSELVIIDTITRLGTHNCVNSISFLWIGIQSAYLVGISSRVDDTRINVLTIFICLVELGISDVIIGYSDQSDVSFSWWAMGLIMIWGVC